MLQLPLLDTVLKTRRTADTIQVWDAVRKIWVALTPEEHVRQSLIQYLIGSMDYPPALMAVEQGISFGHTTLRFDLVVYQREKHVPWMLAECKAPEVQITDAGLQQLLRYQSKLPKCAFWLLTNGHQTYCADAGASQEIKWLSTLPAY